MDTTSEIEMRLMNDLYMNPNNSISKEYSQYYESLDSKQSKIVVSGAIERILRNDKNTRCQFNEDTFTLSIVSNP